jgi:hypothetical protein
MTNKWPVQYYRRGVRGVVKSANLAPDTIVLEDRTRLHWLGSRTAKTILLFSHGAAFSRFVSLQIFG